MTPDSAAVRRPDEPPQGEEFEPESAGSSDGHPTLTPKPGADGVSTVSGEVLLIVDDDPSVLQVASKVLKRGGYEILEAGGGAEALAIAERNEGQISLLLTDVVMPGMGGRELSEAFRTRYPSVRILFMSAYTEDEVILQGVRVAEVEFIPKPFTVQGLRDKVRAVLDRDA